MAEVERLILQLEARLTNYERNLARARRETDRATRSIERRFDRMASNVSSTFKRQLFAGVASVGAILGTRELVRYADGWQSVQNRLLAVGVSATDVAARQEELFQVAIRSRTAFESVASSYARLKLSSEQLGLADRDLLQITETLSKAMQVGGASASEAASAALQLSQALGSGFLQGDELRALRENAPVIAQAIAREFGVAVGELKELGAQGQLSSERVATAIINATEEIEEAFGRTKITISQALTNVESAFQRYIGQAAQTSGVIDSVTAGLELLAENMDVVADVTLALAAVIATALLGRALNPLLASFVAVNRGLAAVAVSFMGAGATAGRLSAALVGAQLSVNTFGRAVSRLGGIMRFLGPGGILAVAVTLFTLFVDVQSKAERAAELHAKALAQLDQSLAGIDQTTRDGIDSARTLVQSYIVATRVALALARAQLAIARQNQVGTAGTMMGEAADFNQDAGGQIRINDAQLQDELDLIAEYENQLDQLNAKLEGIGTDGGNLPPGLDPSGSAAAREDAIADLERQIALNEELIGSFHRGEEALRGIKAAYDALEDARKAGFAEGSNEFETFVAGRARLEFQRRQLDLLKEGAELTASLRTKEEERAATLAKLKELLDAGAISQETYNLAVEQASDEYERQKALLDELQSFGERAFDRIGSAITEAFVQGGDAAIDFGSIVKGVLAEILQEMIRLAVINPLKNALFGSGLPTFGDIGGLLGFGGGGNAAGAAAGLVPGLGSIPGLARGGPVEAGRPYIVGERRPELFVPRTSGTIIPQVPMAASPSPPVVVNVVNRAPDTTAETRESRSGGQESVEVIIDRVVADRLQRNGTASNRALRQMGVRNPLVRR